MPKKVSAKAPKLSRRQQLLLSKKLKELEAIELEIQRRDNIKNPMFYGLPDLMFPQGFKPGTLNPDTGKIDREPLDTPETDLEYIARQEEAIRILIENQLHFMKDGRIVNIQLIDKQVEFIADFLHGRCHQGILWKARGSGGSLCAAILIWLVMIYRHMSFVDLGGSMEQSKVVYEYISAFWECVPGMKETLLEKPPLISMTKLVTGVQLRCITASEKSARGKHHAGLCCDEACQDDVNADTTFSAAMQMSMSEPDHIILLLSTFHHPVGLFQDIWDNAEQKGFKRYKWDIIDVMARCTAGLDQATADDPEAREFCRTQCPLTTPEPVYDDDENFIGNRFVGCDGRGRKATGFLSRENVINAMVLNEGSETFKIEYLCQRPQFSGPIYGLEAIENSLTDELVIDDNDKTLVGIDWGVTEGVLVLGKDAGDAGIQILESKYLSVKVVSEYIKTLAEWQEEYGHLEVYADSSHPFEIGDLEQAGFDVVPVDFATMKEYGVANLLKIFLYDKIKILDDNTRLISQLKGYRKDPKTGRPMKINDHGPDAALCLSITIDFSERWADLITARASGLARTKLLKTMDDLGLNKKVDNKEVEENSIDRNNDVMLF